MSYIQCIPLLPIRQSKVNKKYESIQTQSIIISIFHIFTMAVSELKCERVSVKLTNNNPLTLQFSFILHELL